MLLWYSWALSAHLMVGGAYIVNTVYVVFCFTCAIRILELGDTSSFCAGLCRTPALFLSGSASGSSLMVCGRFWLRLSMIDCVFAWHFGRFLSLSNFLICQFHRLVSFTQRPEIEHEVKPCCVSAADHGPHGCESRSKHRGIYLPLAARGAEMLLAALLVVDGMPCGFFPWIGRALATDEGSALVPPWCV